MTTLRSQIAAARALVDDWKIDSGDIRNELEAMCDRLERACELLLAYGKECPCRGDPACDVCPQSRAFLAGEVTRG